MELINQRYQPVQLLGQGGFGSVYKVADQFEYGKVLALKKIKTDVISRKAIKVFKHEFKFLISLVHPNLVKVHDFDIDKKSDELFFTMEYIQGKSLYKSLKESFSWEKVENDLIQASRALSYIHSKDIIHYDIKPDNIFIDDYGKLKLMDFGFAGSKNPTEVRGTMQFIAPELIQKKDVTHRIDFFSLGVTFYFSITGKLPFKGKDKHEIMANAVKGNYTPLEELRKDIPKKLVKVISRLMQSDPEKRYDSADEIIMELIDDNQKRNSVQFLFTGLGIRSYISSGKLIGRKKELGILLSNSSKVFEEKVFYDNKPVFLIGRYGMGKSSILREYKYLIQLNENIDYFTANFVRGDETKYQAFEIIIQEMFRVYNLNPDQYPGLRFIFDNGDDHSLTPDDSGIAKIRNIEEIDAISDFFCTLATKHRFVLELKDFDNSNSSAINLLEVLTREMRKSPEKGMTFMLVLTIQTENLKSYQKITLKRLRENIHKLEINNLNVLETREYVTQLLMEESIAEEIISFMHKFTGGIPYYINELLIYLFNSNYLSRSKMKWSLNPAFMTDVTAGLRDITYSNFKRFSNIEQAMIKELVVLGRPIPMSMLEVISKVTMINNQIALKFLHKLTDSEVVEKIKYYDGYRYYLAKRLFTNAVTKDFNKDAYSLWSKLTAELIEEKQGVTSDNIYALTDYYYRSERKDKAIDLLERSVNKSLDENNLEFAVTNLKRLYGMIDEKIYPEKKVNTFITIIHNQSVLGNYDSVLDQLVKFEDEDHEMTGINKLKIQLIKYDCSSKAGRYDYLDSTRSWLNAFKIKSSYPKEMKAAYLVWQAEYYSNEGFYTKAVRLFNKALKIYRKGKRDLLEARTVFKICRIRLIQGRLKNVLNEMNTYFETFKKYNESDDILEGYLSLGDIYYRLMDRENSIKYYTECNTLAKDENNISFEVQSSQRLSEFKLNSLNFNDAITLINCGVEKPEDISIADLTSDIYHGRASYYYTTGKLEQALQSIDKSVDIRSLLKRNVKMTESMFLKIKILIRQQKIVEAQKILDITKQYYKRGNVKYMVAYSVCESLINLYSGKYKKALKILLKIRKTVDEFMHLKERISYRIILTLVYEKLRDLNKTMGSIGEAYALYYQNNQLLEDEKILNFKLQILYNKVRCYAGDMDNGIKEMSNIIQFLGNHELPFYKAVVNYNLGQVYLDSDQNYRAVGCFRSAKKEFEKLSTNYPEYKYSIEVIEKIEGKQQDDRHEE
ncbi:MAG: protein kinase [Candidatus Delongbacteria bacterium]|nr:protein kinase [Candidatus Delongbacteria bacterium]